MSFENSGIQTKHQGQIRALNSIAEAKYVVSLAMSAPPACVGCDPDHLTATYLLGGAEVVRLRASIRMSGSSFAVGFNTDVDPDHMDELEEIYDSIVALIQVLAECLPNTEGVA